MSCNELAFADSEYLGAAGWTNSTRCWPTVLQGNILRVLNIHLLPAFEAICLRQLYHLLSSKLNHIDYICGVKPFGYF